MLNVRPTLACNFENVNKFKDRKRVEEKEYYKPFLLPMLDRIPHCIDLPRDCPYCQNCQNYFYHTRIIPEICLLCYPVVRLGKVFKNALVRIAKLYYGVLVWSHDLLR